MILVLSSSLDGTTSLVIDRLDPVPVFRFNIDLWEHYEWNIGANGFCIRDPSGRTCTEAETGAVYLRKLFFNPVYVDIPAGGSMEYWCREELLQVWQGIRDLAHQTGKLALVKPSPAGRWNKIRQMRVAARHFPVPRWEIRRGSAAPPEWTGPTVSETMAPVPMGGGAILMVNRVDPACLDHSFPWFLQEAIEGASHDVTVAWINGMMFSFEASRDSLDGDDCRLPTSRGQIAWSRCELSGQEQDAVRAFMAEVGLEYGRLDFLRREGVLWFLEVNPNGQFAWLDEDGKEGLLDAVADEIKAVHARNSPQPRADMAASR